MDQPLRIAVQPSQPILRRTIDVLQCNCRVDGFARWEIHRDTDPQVAGDYRDVHRDFRRLECSGRLAAWGAVVAWGWRAASAHGLDTVLVSRACSPVTATLHLLSVIGHVPREVLLLGELSETHFRLLTGAAGLIRHASLRYLDLRETGDAGTSWTAVLERESASVVVVDGPADDVEEAGLREVFGRTTQLVWRR